METTPPPPQQAKYNNNTHFFSKSSKVLLCKSDHIPHFEYWTIHVTLKVKITLLYVGTIDVGQKVSPERKIQIFNKKTSEMQIWNNVFVFNWHYFLKLKRGKRMLFLMKMVKFSTSIMGFLSKERLHQSFYSTIYTSFICSFTSRLTGECHQSLQDTILWSHRFCG